MHDRDGGHGPRHRSARVGAAAGLREITSHHDLLVASGGDAFVRYDLPDPLPGPAYALGRAVAGVRVTARRGHQLFVLGPTSEVVELTAAVLQLPSLPPLRGVSVPREAFAAVARRVPLGPGKDWEWMMTRTPPPPAPGESSLVELDADDEPDVTALLERENPHTDARPWATPDQVWIGARAPDGRLSACGCRELTAAGVPVLTGVTVAREWRGQGLGRAVSARLTRMALEAAPVCTLGAYSDNPVALRTYAGLGYGDVHPWASRRLAD